MLGARYILLHVEIRLVGASTLEIRQLYPDFKLIKFELSYVRIHVHVDKCGLHNFIL
jgi:hypothetical protein